MTRTEKQSNIEALCQKAGCSTKKAAVHKHLFVERGWNPHPSARFKDWWLTHPDRGQGIDDVRAYNCERYRQEFLETREVGAA